MPEVGGPGPHPLVGRQRHLVVFLRASTIVAFVLAVGGLILPGRAGTVAGTLLVATLIGVPLVRVAWLCLRWIRRGDVRFALTAGGLLAIVAVGALTAL